MSVGLRLFLDQMLGMDLATLLRQDGHDVSAPEPLGLNRADDAALLDLCIREGRALITLDEHFGDWTVLPLREHPGVIRLRVHPTKTSLIVPVLRPFLLRFDQESFRNHLIILSRRRERWIRTA